MGCLPTYEHIGIAAPVILIMLRILQGVALGGEFGASCVYLYESVPQNKRGFFGSLALTGVGTGLVLSSCTIFIIESYATKQQIYDFAWRIPFFISVFGAIIGYYMRTILLETGDFVEIQKSKNLVNNPFMTMLRNHKRDLFQLFAIFLTTQIAFFVVFIFGKTMMMDYIGFSSYTAGKFILFTVLSYTISTLIYGYLSDILNKRYMILFGVFMMMVMSYPYVSTLLEGNPDKILLLSILMGSIMALNEGTLNPLVAESFPTNIRATSVAFCWNFTSVAFGGGAPIIAMWLMDSDLGPISVAYFLMSACGITLLITALSLRK
jgi:MHS family proline/betaine transporter-like MFS transporter